MAERRAVVLIFLVLIVSACTSAGSVSAEKLGSDAAARLLNAKSFTFSEEDRSKSPIAVGNYAITTSGVRTKRAILGREFDVANGRQTEFTLYATKSVYCHLGGNLSGGGRCEAGDGYDDFITFDALYYLRSIAMKRSHIDGSGTEFTFSGSALNTGTTPNDEERWQGSFRVINGSIVELKYEQTDSEGSVANSQVTFSRIGTSRKIVAPPGAPS